MRKFHSITHAHAHTHTECNGIRRTRDGTSAKDTEFRGWKWTHVYLKNFFIAWDDFVQSVWNYEKKATCDLHRFLKLLLILISLEKNHQKDHFLRMILARFGVWKRGFCADRRNTAKTQQHKQDLPTSQRSHFSVASLQPIASHPSGLWLYILVLTCRHSPELRHRIVSPRGCWEQVSAPSGALFGGRFMLSWGRFLRV